MLAILAGLERPVKFCEGELFVTVIADHRCTVFGGVGVFFMHYYTQYEPFIIIKSTGYTFWVDSK
jgi:hypothetical protein